MDSFKKFKKICKAKSVCLIVHIDPDADALSSMVILQDFLINKFKIPYVDLFAEGDVSDNCLEILDGRQINPAPKQKYDAAVILDCPNLDRTGIYGQLYLDSDIKINIDHHATNNFSGCIRYFDVVSSTCEIVYQLLTYYKYKFSSAELGKIYAALLTDTDGFSVGAVNSTTFKIASACADVVKTEEIYKNFLKHNSLLNQRLYATVVNNIKEYKEGFVVTYISPEQLVSLKANAYDCFGISNQLNSIHESKLTCFISPKGKQWYVSLRAKKGYDVSIIAKAFGGGGHQGAAAYLSNKTLNQIIKEVAKEFKQQIKSITIAKEKLF